MVRDATTRRLGVLPACEREIETARLKCREVKDTAGGEKEKRRWDIEYRKWGKRFMGIRGQPRSQGGRLRVYDFDRRVSSVTALARSSAIVVT